MPKKDVSPLKTAQREGDSLKKKVDENISKCKKLVSDSSKSDKSEKIKAVYERSVELENEVKTLLRKVEDIKEEDERVKISDFNGKKKSEISRLQGFLEDLKLWIKKFEPDDVEEEYLRKASEANKETVEALEEADEELDEDDEEDEEDDEELASEVLRQINASTKASTSAGEHSIAPGGFKPAAVSTPKAVSWAVSAAGSDTSVSTLTPATADGGTALSKPQAAPRSSLGKPVAMTTIDKQSSDELIDSLYQQEHVSANHEQTTVVNTAQNDRNVKSAQSRDEAGQTAAVQQTATGVTSGVQSVKSEAKSSLAVNPSVQPPVSSKTTTNQLSDNVQTSVQTASAQKTPNSSPHKQDKTPGSLPLIASKTTAESATSAEPTASKPSTNTPVAPSSGIDEDLRAIYEEEDYDEELDETVSDEEDYTDDEEDETEYDETMTMSQGATVSQWEALMDFEKDEDADLPMKKGEVVTIINMRDDGWWEAENEKGERGWVPSTYLMVHSKYKDLEEPEENNNVADNTMTVPRINLPTEEDDEEGNGSPKTPKSGKVLWSSIKKAVKETSVTDVLHAMGAVPSGFRQTTLGRLHKDDLHRMKNYLAPKLSPSCLSFKDLFFNPSTNRIRARTARLQKVVTLQVCRQIPNPGSVTDEESSPSVEVESRHIRICLFDGVNVLSNIHNIRISTIDKDQRTWNFNAKMTDNMRCLEFGEFFVRTNSTVDNIGILFELCISYRRVNTGEYGEFSCGWAHLPLYENGAPIQNKAYDMLINGGTPYEKGVEVDPSIGRRANANRLRTLMSGNKQPRLVVKISQPKQEMKEQLDMLPDVLVSSTAFLPFLAFYRQILADALLRDRPDMQSAELIHSPFLAMFAEMIEQPDVMDAFRGIWLEKLKNIKRADKRDNETLKEMFGKVFVETIFPLANMVSLPALMMGDLKNEAVRAEEINKVMKIGKSKKAMLAALLSPDITYTPFDIKEVSFDVLGPYCTTKA